MKQIKSVNQLIEVCSTQGQEFFILLDGGLRSSKSISYNQRSKKFLVHNYIDSTTQRLTSRQLHTQSNIGRAILKGRFFQEEALKLIRF